MKKENALKGYTLIELVLVIVLSSILSITVVGIIARPITDYSYVLSRAELVDASEQTLRRMARDIQRAVPNSLRVKKDPNNPNRIIALEMINIVEGMRYRATPPGNFLDFTNGSTLFNVIGKFQYALTNPTCKQGTDKCRLVVYNTGANGGSPDSPTAGANVYSTVPTPSCGGAGSSCFPPAGSVTITPPGTTVKLINTGTGTSEDQISVVNAANTNTLFALPSPRQRIAIVDTPITYICDMSAGVRNITRYWGYAINEMQPTDPTLLPLMSGQQAVLAQDITNCSFTYTTGSPQNNGMITMKITLSNSVGETVTLIRQVGVNNSS